MRKHIKLGFADFEINWSPWPSYRDFFLGLLSDDFDVEICVDPDYLVFSVPGENHLKYSCPKIFFPVELRHADFVGYEWAMTYDFLDNPWHHRLPSYVLYGNADFLTRPKPPANVLCDRKFCCVLFGKPPKDSPREEFFRKLSEYKKVDSAGRHLNNTGFVVDQINKVEFCRNYKFVISFENEEADGFTTEKVFQPMLANSVPIYWGNKLVGRDFNTKSFVNSHEDASLAETIDRVVALDRDSNLYFKMVEQPYYVGNVVSEYVKRENIVNFFKRVFEVGR